MIKNQVEAEDLGRIIEENLRDCKISTQVTVTRTIADRRPIEIIDMWLMKSLRMMSIEVHNPKDLDDSDEEPLMIEKIFDNQADVVEGTIQRFRQAVRGEGLEHILRKT